MFNISLNTAIAGFSGKRTTLGAALSDKNLHRNVCFEYFGKRVQRGTVEVCLAGSWRTVRFDSADGWAKSLEVI